MIDHLQESAAPLPVRHGVDLIAVAQQADQIKALGQTLIASGMLPESIKKPEAALLVMLKAQEIGIGPVYGLNHIAVVKGKPTLSAELMRALVQRAGHKIRTVELTNDTCTLEGERGDDPGHPQRYTFTMQDARNAGLTGNQTWKKYPKAMLSARATSALSRLMFADAIMGISYTPEELGAEVNEEGEVIEAQSVVEDEHHPEIEGQLSEDHRECMEDINRVLAEIPEGVDVDPEAALEYASRSYEHAIAIERKLKRLIPDDGNVSTSSEVEEGREKNQLPATRNQADLLRALAVEWAGDGGVDRLEKRIGKPIPELDRAEADEWIQRLRPEAAE